MKSRELTKFALLAVLSIVLLSCETVGFYTQAARGQLAIVTGRKNIQTLLDSGELPADLQQKFREVLSIRQFAEDELELPVADNYSTYVDLGREHVVWNVFAAPEFSTDPVNWCYPIAGCVSYRGYFAEAAAQKYALRMEEDGFDVYTGGVDAYSTLGWFDDSLLSTVLSRSGYQLAGLVFHELAHQLVYVPGDTTFNESFATAIEREGVRRWLLQNGQPEVIAIAETDSERQQQFVELVSSYRDEFDALYEQEIDDAAKRDQKAQLQEALRQDYQALKQVWGGYQGYDSWFDRSLNNAQLSTVSSYNEFVPFFDSLLQEHEGNLRDFYDTVSEIASLSAEERERLIGESW